MPSDPQPWQEVEVGGVRIAVSPVAPVAVVGRGSAAAREVSWPRLDVGLRAPEATVLAAPTGAWVWYRPSEAFDETVAPGTAAAVHIGVDGELTTFAHREAVSVVGADAHGLWLHADAAFPDPRDPPAWLVAHDATVLGPDGRERTVGTDRRVAFVFADGDEHVIAIHASPPRVIPTGRGGARIGRSSTCPRPSARRRWMPCGGSSPTWPAPPASFRSAPDGGTRASRSRGSGPRPASR